MKRIATSLLTAVLLLSHTACLAQTPPEEPSDPEKPVVAQSELRPPLDPRFKSGVFTPMALIETQREPRPWKWLKLLPGKETRWWYRCLNPAGITITKEALGRIEGVDDERPLKQSHPNVWIAREVGTATIPTLMGVTVGGVFSRK